LSADWFAAIGQVAGAVFTACAIVVALAVAARDNRARRMEEARRSLAQARLVLVGAPRVEGVGQSGKGFKHELIFDFANYGDRPVLGVTAEAWAKQDEGRDLATWIVVGEIALTGGAMKYVVRVAYEESNLEISRWRVRWTDADGRAWYFDRDGGPHRF
jgi:hypothetical protein